MERIGTVVQLDIANAVADFITTKRVGGCSSATIEGYEYWLNKLANNAAQLTPLDVQKFFAALKNSGLKPASIHKCYAVVQTFVRWLIDTDQLDKNPLRGFKIRLPRSLPRPATEEDVRLLLKACPDTYEGIRNRAIILVICDAGLRNREVCRLLVEHWDPTNRGLTVRGGKGDKDRQTFVEPVTARALKLYLAQKQSLAHEDFLFTTWDNRPLTPRNLLQIFHRLSAGAGLPTARRLHPHSLRHLAATSWLRNGMTLEEVRRLLGHATLQMVLRYAHLVGADIQKAHKKAAAIERMKLD